MKCPLCGGMQTGKVGADQWYCWNCAVEWNVKRGHLNLYEVAEDGTLIALNDSPAIER